MLCVFYQQTSSINLNNFGYFCDFFLSCTQSDFYAPYLHDAFLLYTILSAEAEDIGCGYTNGSCIMDRALNRKFDGPGMGDKSMQRRCMGSVLSFLQ